MSLAEQIKPVSYLKANAAELLRSIGEGGEPVIITQNGEAKAVLQDVAAYERTRQTMALLKLMALGTQDIEDGRTVPARAAIERLRQRRDPAA